MREIPIVPPEEIEPDRLKTDEQFTPERQEQRDRITKKIFEHWRGDLHTHSVASSRESWGYAEGVYSEREIVKYYEKLGLEFVAFAEHATKPGEPHQAEINDRVSQAFLEQIERIEGLNRESEVKVAALASAESNIMFDNQGKPVIDLPDKVLEKLDIVIASRHGIKDEKDINAIRESLLMAADNPHVDIIGHPDRYIRLEGGVMDKDKPCTPEKYWETWDEILEAIAKNGKAFEINLNNPPSDQLVARAAQKELKFVLNFDAHDFEQYGKSGTKAKQIWAKGEAKPADIDALASYKESRLQSGPGYKAIRRLMLYIKNLESLGVDKCGIVNSSRDRLLEFLTEERGKKTDNLELLKEKFNHE